MAGAIEQVIFKPDEVVDFGIPGVSIQATLYSTYDPYSGMDINLNTFQNTNQGLTNSNQDGRIELGMFSFDDDNLAADNFPNILGPPFVGITKTNLVSNQLWYGLDDDRDITVNKVFRVSILNSNDEYIQVPRLVNQEVKITDTE